MVTSRSRIDLWREERKTKALEIVYQHPPAVATEEKKTQNRGPC
jgi:hypothetical protein